MKRIWDVEELAQCWSLSFEELELLKTKPARNHLGFIAQLKYYPLSGKFPQHPTDIPDIVLHYLADQLEQRLAVAKTNAQKQASRDAHDAIRPFTPDRPGIADAFRDWGRKQGFGFCFGDGEEA